MDRLEQVRWLTQYTLPIQHTLLVIFTHPVIIILLIRASNYPSCTIPYLSSPLCHHQHRVETQDLVTVLIAALTALDQHTEGELTSEFTTTLMGFMMEELDGNTF